jgi:GNAT superfamily N-acetyltransferase
MRELLTRPTFREALLRAGGRGISVGITEGITETAQELSVIAGAQFAAMADGRDFSGSLGTLQQNWERMMAAGYGGFQAGIVFGGVGATAGLAVDIPRARRADRDQEMITALGDMAEQSALRRRLPERFHAWVDALTANGPMDTIWIDAVAFRTFYQSQGVDPDAVADALPSVGRDALAAAIDARDDIAISLPDYATYIAGTPSQEGLREHTRMHPDADTLAEARHNLANQENVQERIEEAAREADLQGDEQEAQQLIARDMRRRLDLAGVTVSDANQVQAEAIAAAIVESSRKAGENPIETYRRYWADIRGPLEEVEAIPATRTLEQAPAADLDALSADLKGRFGLAELRLTATADGDVVVDEIAVDRKGQRKGNGTAAMRELIKYADRNGIRLRATAPKRGGAYGTTSQARSKAFLEAFGFIENKGKQRDGTISEGMYRPPVGRRRVSQAEVSQTTNRFDPRAVDPAGGTSAPGIPEIGTADFALVLEAAQEKLEAGAPLSYLEAYAINQATAANMPAGGQLSSREYFSREGEDGPNPDNPYDRFGVHRVTPTKKGGVNPELDGTNKRAGPLPPRAPDAEPLTPEQLRQTKLEVNKPVRTVGVGAAGGSAVRKVSLKNIPNVPKEPVAPEAQARLRQLEAERQALEAIIQERMDMELDLPSVEAARKDAAVMRAAAYCTARERIRRVAAVQRVGGAIGGTAATVGGLAIVGNTTEIAPGTPAETPATAPPPPPPAVELPVMDAEEVMAELPAEDAIRADLPEALEEALAESAEVEPPSEAETAAALARRLAYENADPQEPIPLPSEVMQ